MAIPVGRVAATACLLSCACASQAVTLGQVDTFAGGSVDGWGSGSANPTPPVNIAGGGPGGATDSYLLLESSGAGGPGGKLVAFNGAQWAGDYATAGVGAVTMQLANFGPADLRLRLQLNSPGGPAVTLGAVAVAAGSGWQAVRFSLAPDALSGSVAAALSGATELRLFHSAGQSLLPVDVAVRLGVDNIRAVPEPGTWAMLGLGLACLALRRRH